MKAMIMAAGVGSRLEPLTCNIPKPMVPIANRPAMEHIINLLAKNNIKQIGANLWYLPEKIQAYFKDGSEFGVELTYSLEKELMGTAGGVKKMEDFLDDTFVIISGDALTDIDLWDLIDYHKDNGSMATIALKEVYNPRQFGVVITGDDGRIRAFQEKPEPAEALSRLANTGIYVFEPEIFDLIPAETIYDFGKQLFPTLVEKQAPFFGYQMDGYWCDIGSLNQYCLANYDVLRGQVKMEVPGNWHPDAIYVGERTAIAPTSRIGSKVIIGNNCHIGHGVEIFGETVIGDNCIIEDNTSIFGSIVWRNSRIGREARLVESVIGSECYLKEETVIGAGVILGDSCVVESGSIVDANSKIWPKEIIRC